MALGVLKVLVAGILISFCSWLAGKKPILAGFLTALPLTTLIALAFQQLEWKSPDVGIQYAKSILFAFPLSLLFFVPYLLPEKWPLGFWGKYFLGIFLLFLGYLFHSYVVKKILV